jgi:hypothetical protein
VTPVEQAAQVLAKHRFTAYGCTCGWHFPHNEPMLPVYEQHLAQALADAGLLTDPGALDRVRAEALTQARDEISNMLVGFPAGGRHTRAWWAVAWLDIIISRSDRADRIKVDPRS